MLTINTHPTAVTSRTTVTTGNDQTNLTSSTAGDHVGQFEITGIHDERLSSSRTPG
jgi:hypothetical protein